MGSIHSRNLGRLLPVRDRSRICRHEHCQTGSFYLSRYSSYALINGLIDHYVVEREMTISNGNRSIAHETGFQDLLLKLGFRKEFCRLNVVYHPWLKPLIKAAFTALRVMDRFSGLERQHKLKALLLQEELSKRCRPHGQ